MNRFGFLLALSLIALLFAADGVAEARLFRRNAVQVNVNNGAAAQVNVRQGFFRRNAVQVNVNNGAAFVNRSFAFRQFHGYSSFRSFGYGAAFAFPSYGYAAPAAIYAPPAYFVPPAVEAVPTYAPQLCAVPQLYSFPLFYGGYGGLRMYGY